MNTSRDQVDLRAEEYLLLRRNGADLSIDDFVAQFPSIAHEIREVIDTLLFVDDFKPTSKPPSTNVVAEPQLSDYEIDSEIGRGGMGIVYHAKQISLSRDVALKVMPEIGSSGDTIQRFELEAQTAAKLHHSNIVPVFDVGCENGTHYYSMQFIDGDSLDLVMQHLIDLRDQSPVTDRNSPDLETVKNINASGSTIRSTVGTRPYYRNVAQIGQQVASALEYAHQQSVIHRDIKPSNLLLDSGGTIWITDFGLAKAGDHNLTRTGDVVGTIRYMSPERFDGVCDHRSDIYSLGITLYELLSITPAFGSDDRLDLIDSIKNETPKRLRAVDPKIPIDLQTIVEKAIEKEPARRYATAADLENDLTRFLNGQPIRARQVGSLEKLYLWSKKHKALASSLATIAFLLLASSIASTWAAFHFRDQEAAQKQLVKEKEVERKRTVEQKVLAESKRDEAYQNAYYADMQLAQEDWENGQVRRMLETLKRYVPAYPAQDVRNWEWYYLLSLAHQDRKTILEHNAPVFQVCWSPDNDRLYSAGKDGTLRIWNADGEPIQQLSIPNLARFSISPSGQQVATVSGDKALRIWDTTSFELTKVVQLDLPSADLVDWNKQGDQIAVASRRKSHVFVLNTENWEVSATTSIEDSHAVLGFSPNGQYLAYGERPVKIWSFEKQEVMPYPGIWDLKSSCLAWHPDSSSYAVGGFVKSCHVFDVKTAKNTVRLFDGLSVESVCYTSDGKQLLVADRRQKISVFDCDSWKLQGEIKGHLGWVQSAQWNRDGNQIVSAGRDGAIKIWNWLNQSQQAPVVQKTIGTSPDGRWNWRLEPKSKKSTLISDASSGQQVAEIPVKPTWVKFFPHWRRMVVMDPPYTGVFETDSWQQEFMLSSGNASTGGSGSAHHRDHWVIGKTGQIPNPGTMFAIDLRTGEKRDFYPHYRSGNLIFAISNDSTRLMTGCHGEIKIWDLESLTEIHTLYGHPPGQFLMNGGWSSSDRYVATYGWGQSMFVWDTVSGKLVNELVGHQATISSSQFSGDDSRLMTIAENIKVWDFKTGREVLSISRNGNLDAHLGSQAKANTTTSEYQNFQNRSSADGFGLNEDELKFRALEQAVRIAKNSSSVQQFEHANTHSLAEVLVSTRHEPPFADARRALELAQQAARLTPTNSKYLFTLALAHIRNKNWQDAMDAAEKIVGEDNLTELRVNILRARCLAELSDREQAKRKYEAAVRNLRALDQVTGLDLEILNETFARLVHMPFENKSAPRTITVDNLSDDIEGVDDGKTSLREAVFSANAGDTIKFSVSGTIKLEFGELHIQKPIAVVGPGMDKLTIDAQARSRHFLVADTNNDELFRFELSGLSLVNGEASRDQRLESNRDIADAGGAIYSNEEVVLANVNFDSCHAYYGGAVFTANKTKLEISSCRFLRNSAHKNLGGAIYVAGVGRGEPATCNIVGSEFADNQCVLMNCGYMTVENCTFTANYFKGPAICFVEGFESRFSNCTIVQNKGKCAFYMTDNSPNWYYNFERTNRLIIENSILFGNESPEGTFQNFTKRIPTLEVDARFCIFESADANAGKNNLTGVDPMLGAFQFNGGMTRTFALQSESPAIDAGNPDAGDIESTPEFDQRGKPFKRIFDGNVDETATIDIGAFEFQR